MRIAFVTHQFFPDYYTGVERATLNLAQQLKRMGHDSVVVTPTLGRPERSAPYEYGGIRVRTVDEGEVDRLRPWAAPEQAGATIGQILDDESVDLVHVMHAMRLPQVFAEAERRDLPTVVHLHDYDYMCYRITLVRVDESLCTGAARGYACASVCECATGPERIEWAQARLAAAAGVISPSRFLIEAFAAEGFDTTDWRHVPCGIDYALFQERLPPRGADGALHIGFVGTLVPHKGVHVLIEAIRLLPERPIRLSIYGESFGDAKYDYRLRQLAGVDRRIRFCGSYEHDGFRDVLAALNVVALPSVWYENYPTSAVNAVAAGIPLIVSDTGGMREIVEDYNCGFAFRLGDADSLAELLERLLQQPELLLETRRQMRYPPSIEEEAWAVERIYEGALRTTAHSNEAQSERSYEPRAKTTR